MNPQFYKRLFDELDKVQQGMQYNLKGASDHLQKLKDECSAVLDGHKDCWHPVAYPYNPDRIKEKYVWGCHKCKLEFITDNYGLDDEGIWWDTHRPGNTPENFIFKHLECNSLVLIKKDTYPRQGLELSFYHEEYKMNIQSPAITRRAEEVKRAFPCSLCGKKY